MSWTGRKKLDYSLHLVLLPVRPVLVLYSWEDGSYFDTIMNEYQTKPHGLLPLDPKILGCDGGGDGRCGNGTELRAIVQ